MTKVLPHVSQLTIVRRSIQFIKMVALKHSTSIENGKETGLQFDKTCLMSVHQDSGGCY